MGDYIFFGMLILALMGLTIFRLTLRRKKGDIGVRKTKQSQLF